MTQLLEEAMSELSRLPDGDQDRIAAMILEELEDDRKWDATFQRSHSELSKLADKVRMDIQTGKTKEMGFDEL